MAVEWHVKDPTSGQWVLVPKVYVKQSGPERWVLLNEAHVKDSGNWDQFHDFGLAPIEDILTLVEADLLSVSARRTIFTESEVTLVADEIFVPGTDLDKQVLFNLEDKGTITDIVSLTGESELLTSLVKRTTFSPFENALTATELGVGLVKDSLLNTENKGTITDVLTFNTETHQLTISSLPVIDSLLATDDSDPGPPASWEGRCQIDPGADVQSVALYYSINSGSYVFLENVDVSPNGPTVWSSYVSGNENDTLRFRGDPYDGDNATGTQGTSVFSNTVTLQGVA